MVVNVEETGWLVSGMKGKTRWLGDGVFLPHLVSSKILGTISLFKKVLLDLWPAFLIHIMKGACCGLFDVDFLGNILFEDNIMMYWVGWDMEVGGALIPGLGLADSVGRSDALTVPTASSAVFCRNFEGRATNDCSGGLHIDTERSRCNVYMVVERAVFGVHCLGQIKIL